MNQSKLEKYKEILKREEVDGWFRYRENQDHIFFSRRKTNGEFEYKSVKYCN